MLRTIIILMSLIAVSNCKWKWPFSKFDPDIDICENPYFNGGVVAEDGETYLFKGDYFWRTRPLTTDSGIVGYAKLTASKWPDINDTISLVFTVSQANALITVFVVKNNWFGYQKGLKTMDGTVDSWPDFNNLKVTTALTTTYGGNMVYVLHSDNINYNLYDFTSLSKPKKVRTGLANIRSNYVVFIDDTAHQLPGVSIKSLINVRVALTYRGKLFLLSKETFCEVNLISKSYERECNPENVNNILDCPLDISRRPTVMTTATESALSLSTATNSLLQSLSDSVSVEDPAPDSTQNSNLNKPIRTGISILGEELEEEAMGGNYNSTDDLSERNRRNSGVWIVFILVGMIVVFLIAILIVAVVYRIMSQNRRKGQIILIE